jgi:hypothetical protein
MYRLLTLLLTAYTLLAHDPSLHRTRSVTGRVTATTDNGVDLQTRTATIKVTFTPKTRFERRKKPAPQHTLTVGEWIGVVGNEAHSGDFVAREVILGLPAPTSAPKP